MNKIEFAVAAETVVETTEQPQTFELSLSELDMVGGGSIGSVSV